MRSRALCFLSSYRLAPQLADPRCRQYHAGIEIGRPAVWTSKSISGGKRRIHIWEGNQPCAASFPPIFHDLLDHQAWSGAQPDALRLAAAQGSAAEKPVVGAGDYSSQTSFGKRFATFNFERKPTGFSGRPASFHNGHRERQETVYG